MSLALLQIPDEFIKSIQQPPTKKMEETLEEEELSVQAGAIVLMEKKVFFFVGGIGVSVGGFWKWDNQEAAQKEEKKAPLWIYIREDTPSQGKVEKCLLRHRSAIVIHYSKKKK